MASLEVWRTAFDRFDKNQNGVLELCELDKMFDYLGLHKEPAELEDIMTQFDLNKDRVLNRSEFCALVASIQPNLTLEAEMRLAFLVFDINGDGVLTKEEISSVMSNLEPSLTKEGIENLFQHVDLNADGKIDYLEFVEAIKERYYD
eukprot:TRINITY_DN5324_c0_g1_i2.p1 TRINITY_DN5324_c0_g1~~TRINITY_DN5324_c0_g1_i2.p1  ORF type:complete len:162 (-),score=33.30 TRINITY_DN5324_c0_g1_i2:54-494(-)